MPPQTCFHVEIGKHHAHCRVVTESPLDRNMRKTYAADERGLRTDLYLSVLIRAAMCNPYGESVIQIVPESYIDEAHFRPISYGIAVAESQFGELSPLVGTERT